MYPFIRFLLTGAGGALINLVVTYFLTKLVFGIDHYFLAYLLGIAANLTWNFALYTYAVFKTKEYHTRRLTWFLAYGFVMSFFQASIVRVLVVAFGTQYYLMLIAITIGVLAALNYFIFRQNIFKQHAEKHTPSHDSLALICLMAVLVRLGVLFHALATVGLSALVYGDAVGYRALAQNVWQGRGFIQVINAIPVAEVFRTPGFPFILAPFAGSDAGISSYLCLLAIISGILLPYFTYRITSHIAGPSAGIVAAIFVAFEPQLIFFSVLPQTEMPFMLFAYGALLFTLENYSKTRYIFSAFSGVLFGYATFIRPGFWPVYVLSILGFLLYELYKRTAFVHHILIMILASVITLMPWYLHVYEETGVFALSGAGWRNVYTDYLASERAVRNHSEFAVEKDALKSEAATLGISRQQVNSPASARILRKYALHELWQEKVTVLKLETFLIESYVLQDGYYYQFVRFGFLHPDPGPHISPTFVLLSEGLHGIPKILHELARQGFLPIVGRIVTGCIALFAGIGFFTVKNRLRFIFAVAIVLSAITATVIGLGVEARLRLPIEPLLFAFAATGIFYIRSTISLYANRHRRASL